MKTICSKDGVEFLEIDGKDKPDSNRVVRKVHTSFAVYDYIKAAGYKGNFVIRCKPLLCALADGANIDTIALYRGPKPDDEFVHLKVDKACALDDCSKVGLVLSGFTGSNAGASSFYSELLSQPISDLDLSIRARGLMAVARIESIGDLINKSESDLLKYRNVGAGTITEIRRVLARLHLTLKEG